jgi:hypothetical protein
METQTLRKALSLLCTVGIAGGFLAGAMSTGCGSSKTATPGGVGGTSGGSTGTGSSAAGGGTSGASNGGTGFGGTSAGGTGGRGTGGAGGIGSGGAATGGVGSGGVSTGGIGGAATGGSGPGGVSAGGSAGTGSGARGSGGIGTGGARNGGTDGGGNLDAGSTDAPASLDTPPACSQLTTQAACDQRGDCHSVSEQQSTCNCSTPGCCMTFDRCDSGGAVSCNGPVACSATTPLCQAPYVVQYGSGSFGCFYGCVLASKCSNAATCPPTAPADGASCGATDLNCSYQDCAGAGRIQANCQGGVWSVQTVTCASIACTGDGTYTGGTLYCGPGQICARNYSVGGAYFIIPTCVQDTCAPAPVSIQCLTGLPGAVCNVSPTAITCSARPTGAGGAGGGAGAAGGALGGGGNVGAGGGSGSHLDAGAMDAG